MHSSLPLCPLLLCCRYKLAENIDAQLKRMAQDLKDIIEHLNTSGGPADNSDPVSTLVVQKRGTSILCFESLSLLELTLQLSPC